MVEMLSAYSPLQIHGAIKQLIETSNMQIDIACMPPMKNGMHSMGLKSRIATLAVHKLLQSIEEDDLEICRQAIEPIIHRLNQNKNG